MIDLEKYGFLLLRENDGYFVYVLNNDGYAVYLHVCNGSYSIDVVDPHEKIMNVAQRFQCDTKEQVEFLLFNSSRAGWIIKSKLP